MFLKSYTELSNRKLANQINANYEYQFFYGVEILPENKIKNFKIVSEIQVELASKLNILSTQKVLAQAWKPIYGLHKCSIGRCNML